MKTKIFTKRFIQCPGCAAGDHPVEHLGNGASVGPWSCKHCGTSIRLKLMDDVVDIEICETQRVTNDRVAILKLKNADLYLLKDHSDYDDKWRASDDYHFLYEEHQCPANLLNSTYGVVIEGNTDKHRAFEFLGMMPRPINQDEIKDWIQEHRPDLFDQMFIEGEE